MLLLPTSYQFTAKDLQGSALAWKRVRRQANGAQASFSFLQESDFGRVPSDRVWLITQVSAQLTPDPTQQARGVTFTENDKIEVGGAPLGLVAYLETVNNDIIGKTELCHYIVQPDHHIRAFAQFDLGAAQNIVVLDVAGWLIPRANIEFAGSS